jgi:hypothetical protein
MRLQRLLGAVVLAASTLFASACAINRASGGAEPDANLTAIKTVHVVHATEDGRNINELITQQLTQMGFVATTSADKRKDVDANMTYVDRWMWDLTMYMIELTLILRDPATDFPLARGNSFHTSLTRLSPKEMVQEVTANMFKDVKK